MPTSYPTPLAPDRVSVTMPGRILTSGFLLSILSLGGAITGNIVAYIPLVASWRGTLRIAIGLVLTLRR